VTEDIEIPAVGQSVHYVSYGTPGGEYGRCCRAATVTESGGWVATEVDSSPTERMATQVWDTTFMSLCVMNPTGLFFNDGVKPCTGEKIDEPTKLCNGLDYCGGSWHWPEKV
jgi:hypothetical protein